ncbi:MAG TPA: hypothetical protein PK771_13610, partial [Spirochaetota bacterium]|nr:hypothetical protein [Spirochaetota bacterium]
IPKIDFFKVEYICGFYDNSNDTLFASIKNQNEDDATLSKQSFDFFYNNRQNQNTSGLYFTKDFGKTWNKTKINIPVALWKCNEIIYGSTIYPLSFYKKELSENLKKSSIYKTGKINSESSGKEDFLKTMLSFETDDYQIISIKNNKLIKFNDINNYEIIEEKDFTNIYYGLKKLENIPFIHNTKSERTVSNNIYYEYEPYRFFKLWSGFKINSPVLYAKYGDIFYRVRPLEKYLNNFIRYSLENQIKFNSTNPFLRRVNDVEFFDPTLDPTNGFPIVFECSKDFGTTWDNIYDTKHIKTIIDPLGTKRNVFYWLKNVEEKKNFKLRISFGFGDAPNLLLYPTDLKIVDKDLFIIFNYFSLNKNYQDGYLLPIK